jgi:type II secretory ATPase GspE/PulE/Tfp pilus assembly ATPase PilB-like protein
MLADLSDGNAPLTTAFAGKGCARCKGTGFKGRTGIHEMLLCDEEMFEAAGTDLALGNIRRIADQRGMTTMFHDCLEKVRTGLVPADALYEVVGSAGVEDKDPEKKAA